jgi:hypothetical protein
MQRFSRLSKIGAAPNPADRIGGWKGKGRHGCAPREGGALPWEKALPATRPSPRAGVGCGTRKPFFLRRRWELFESWVNPTLNVRRETTSGS